MMKALKKNQKKRKTKEAVRARKVSDPKKVGLNKGVEDPKKVRQNRPVKIVEVGMRDGLQNEPEVLTLEEKITFAQKLSDSGIHYLEAGAFVRTDKIPQMAQTTDLLEALFKMQSEGLIKSDLSISALVPNKKGLIEAMETPLKEIAVFGAVSETFSKKNINCSIKESFDRFAEVIKTAKKHKIKVRGYLSTAFGCPYEGLVSEEKVVELALQLHRLGCYEISIGDTIGVATPLQVESLFTKLIQVIPIQNLAGHFHDTRGIALANIACAFRLGIRIFDSSLGGLGGCPYALGSAGNVATEEVVYLFEKMNITTGIKLDKLIEVHYWVSEKMKKALPSRVAKAGNWP